MFVAQLNGHYLKSLEEAITIQMQYISLESQIISGLERKLLWGYGLYSFSFAMLIFFEPRQSLIAFTQSLIALVCMSVFLLFENGLFTAS